MDAARQILRERGFEADIREILRLAGVGTGTAYRHFPNKQALVRAVIDELRHKVGAGLSEAADAVDAREAVAKTMQVGFRTLEEYGHLAIALFGGTEPDEFDGAMDRVSLERFFAALLKRGIKQGHFRPDLDVGHAVGVWFALTAPSALARLLESDGRSVDEIATLTTRFYTVAISVTAE